MLDFIAIYVSYNFLLAILIRDTPASKQPRDKSLVHTYYKWEDGDSVCIISAFALPYGKGEQK